MEQIKIYSDGGARGNPGPAASAFVVVKDDRVIFKESKFLGRKTNNQAEYNGVIMALSWLIKNKDLSNQNSIAIFLDSQLVTRQLKGLYKIKNKNLKSLNTSVKNLEKKIPVYLNYFSVPRENNRLADALVNKKIDENI